MTEPVPAAVDAGAPVTVLIVASRLHPGRDGGYTVAAMQRALDLERYTQVTPRILTFDVADTYDEHLEGFRAIGLADARTTIENLFVWARANPSLIRSRAERIGMVAAPRRPGTAPPAASRTVVDDRGQPLLTLPFVPQADWWRAPEPIIVHDEHGAPAAVLGGRHESGFGVLYRLWVQRIVADERAAGSRVVVLAESKQVGELLVGLGDQPASRDYAVVQALTSAHTLAPHTPDAPMDAVWSGWFEVVDRFDAVLWLTEQQRADAIARFGPHPGWQVMPHPARPPASIAAPGTRDPRLVVMIARLVPVKRVDHAIRAWARVVETLPDARLVVLGDGPLRDDLEILVDTLGLTGSIEFAGHVPNPGERVGAAAVALMTSEYEGQSLAVLEALAAATVPVAYDIRYGPAELIEPGVTGALVPDGDETALADAVTTLLADPARRIRMAHAARAWALEHQPPAAATRLAALLASLAY